MIEHLELGTAAPEEAEALAALHNAVADELTRRYGIGPWSWQTTERGVLSTMRKPKFSRILTARAGEGRIVAALRLATQKPWAIDAAYFTPVKTPLYLTGMAVHPEFQRCGVGRWMLRQAEAEARAWPGGAIRLDAFDADAGAGPFYLKCGLRQIARVAYKDNPLIYFEQVLL